MKLIKQVLPPHDPPTMGSVDLVGVLILTGSLLPLAMGILGVISRVMGWRS